DCARFGWREWLHPIRAIPEAAADFAEHARAVFKPGGRDDEGVDEGTLDALKRGRLVTLVDDAHRHQQHPRPHVERTGHQEIDVRLFQLDLTAPFPSPEDTR